MEEVEIVEGAEDFRLGDGSVAALVVHGFGSTPQSVRPLGEYLAARGVSVASVRLPGHGTAWQDLATTTDRDWSRAVEDAFHQLVASKQEVFLVGLSFGAALCLDIAARYPERPRGLVALAPFLFTRDPRRFFAPLIRLVARSIPGVNNDIADAEPTQREIAYERLPTRAADAMLRYARRVHDGLPAIRCPLLLIHSVNDHTSPPQASQRVFDAVSSEKKELVWLQRSYHVLPLDVEREDVFERTFRFMKEHSSHGL